MTALMVAMCRANSLIVVEMLEAGADPFETDKGGNVPLMAAAMYVLLSVAFEQEVLLYQFFLTFSLM